ncbi:hypothetical protein FKW77_003191, partial [Venturia effusa]
MECVCCACLLGAEAKDGDVELAIDMIVRFIQEMEERWIVKPRDEGDLRRAPVHRSKRGNQGGYFVFQRARGAWSSSVQHFTSRSWSYLST